MITPTLVFEIGGVFLLSAALMYGALVRGIIPKSLRNAKSAGLALGVVVLALIAYQYFPQGDSGSDATPLFEVGSPEAAASQVPVGPAPVRKHVMKQVQPPSHAVIAEVPSHAIVVGAEPLSEIATPVSHEVSPEIRGDSAEAVHEAEAVVPTPEPSPSPTTDNRAVRVVKSIGRFLHIGHEKPDEHQPPQTESH